MALIKCTECSKEVSDKAAACPNCGCPVSNQLNKFQNLHGDSTVDNDITPSPQTGHKSKPVGKSSRNMLVPVIVMLVLAVLIFTNPTKDDYVNFINNKLMEEAQGNSIASGVINLFGKP
nr:hypothetical protein [Desulfitobacterium hafniense]